MLNIAWHSHKNLVSFTTSDGELYIYTDFVPPEFAAHLNLPSQRSPFIHDPLTEVSGNSRKAVPNSIQDKSDPRVRRKGTPDSLDDILGSDGGEDDFVVDDDGAGYAFGLNTNGKRTNGHLDYLDDSDPKRRANYETWEPHVHQPFQSGSTPWRGNRRYLCRPPSSCLGKHANPPKA